MDEKTRRPLVLIVDDDEEFREKIIPAALEELSIETVGASNVQEALDIASRHDPQGSDPIDLVILDMHIQLSAKEAEVDENGGIHFLRGYKMIRCPVIVFTAYPSFENCVRAVKAGATDYIPKNRAKTITEEGGVDHLLEVSKGLLQQKGETAISSAPIENWLDRNYDWLVQRYHGRFITILNTPPSGALRQSVEERDGLFLLSGSSYKELRDIVTRSEVLWKQLPLILRIQRIDEDFAAHGQEEAK